MGCHSKIQDMYKAIEVMMIIHNISIEWGDKPEVENGIIGGEPHIPLHETENWLLEQGRQKWLILLNELIPE